MRLYLDGPRIGPLHSVLWSWSSRSRRRSPAARSRFSSPWYWLLGIFTLELCFWVLYGMAYGVLWAVRVVWRH